MSGAGRLGPFKLFGLVAGAVLLILAARYCVGHYVDFPVYWHATQSLLTGRQDLYAQNYVWGTDSWMTYRYPPLFLLLFTPLGALPYATAGYIWFALKFAALVVTLRLLYRMLEVERTRKLQFWLLSLLITTPYLLEEFHYGNVHFFIVFLSILALYLFETGKWISSAMALALAISIKVFPVFFVPWFFITRKFRYVALTLLLVVLLNLLPGFYFGFKQNSVLLQTWYDHVIRNRELHELNSGINQSFKGILQRYLSHVPYEKRQEETVHSNINLANLRPESLQTIWYISTVLVVSLVASLCVLQRNQEDRGRRLLVYGLIACAILGFAPSTGFNYMVLLLLPGAAVSAYLMQHYREKQARTVLVLAVVAVLLSVIPPLIPGRFVQRQMQLYSPGFFSTLVLLICIVVTLVQARRSHEAAPGTGVNR